MDKKAEYERIVNGKTDGPLESALHFLVTTDSTAVPRGEAAILSYLQMKARLEEQDAALLRVTTILCETRKHAGKRPCKFCVDMNIPLKPSQVSEEEQG